MTKIVKTDLEELARRIRDEHKAVAKSLKAGLDHALAAGALLIEAKKAMPHGEWLTWVSDNCQVSKRTAQAYMRLTREMPKLEPEKAQRVALLSYREAIRHLADGASMTAKLPPESQQQVIERLEDGSPNLRDAVRRVQREKSAATELVVPAGVLPRTHQPNGRIVKVLAEREKRLLSIVVGPNQSGANLERNVETVCSRTEYRQWQETIDGMNQRANDLRAEAVRLESEAKQESEARRISMATDMAEEFGPPYNYVETYDYGFTEEAFDKLDERWSTSELVEHLHNNPDGVFYLSEGRWGDIGLMGCSANGPNTNTFNRPQGTPEPIPDEIRSAANEAGRRVGWHGIGSLGWLHEFFGEIGLAPPAAGEPQAAGANHGEAR